MLGFLEVTVYFVIFLCENHMHLFTFYKQLFYVTFKYIAFLLSAAPFG